LTALGGTPSRASFGAIRPPHVSILAPLARCPAIHGGGIDDRGVVAERSGKRKHQIAKRLSHRHGFYARRFQAAHCGLAEKRPSKSQIVNPFVSAVRDALARENWYAALALALTLPDICVDLEKPKRGVGARYTQWWNTYLSRKYNGALSGDDCYKLRCTFLHQGLGNIRFVFPDPSGRLRPHCNRINGVLQLQVDLFCEHICEGIERWEQKKLPEDPEIQKRANKMLVIFPPEMFAAPNL
jgi:hypothetical protein